MSKHKVKTIEETTFEAPETSSESGVPAPETSSSRESAVTVSEKGAPPSQEQVSQRPGYDHLMLYQAVKSTPPDEDIFPGEKRLGRGSISLYRALQPQNAQESIICSLLVGLHNAAQISLKRGIHAPLSQVRELDLKSGVKAALAVLDLSKHLETLRSGNKHLGTVQVGTVNIEAGAQAVVGHVETRVRESNDSDSDQVVPAVKKRDAA
ncbi:MAG TPA: hypothetical protein VNO69_03030 [Methyloceanibacter sp.]|nr:hypothetical protein [Methyloceanibacter sp.]